MAGCSMENESVVKGGGPGDTKVSTRTLDKAPEMRDWAPEGRSAGLGARLSVDSLR